MEIRSIFDSALQITDPAKRSEYLDDACENDPELRRQIEELLDAQQQLGSFLEEPAVAAVATELVSGDEEALRPSSGDTLPDIETQALEFLSASENPEAIGQLGHYEILEVIGRGGMGIVLRGVDPKLNRVVAIKVLSPDFAANPSAHKRFLREAQAAAAVSHDHIVTIHAVEENPIPHLVMEYIDGKSLQQKIDEEGQLEVKEVLRIARQVAAGLAAAHEQGLTHRDIKPSNILLKNGIQRVQITDFGLARATADADITRTGEIAGTPQYMSPEQAQSKPVDPRSDLFSLGSVMYAMCCGRSPFRAETPYGSIKRVCEDEPRSLRENNPEIPTWLEAIIFKLLSKSPDDRFQTAEEVAELLAKHLSHLHDPGSTPFPGKLQVKPTRRRLAHPRLVASVAVILLALLTVGFTEAVGVTNFAGTVIRMATGEGTLVIEVDDPLVQVSLDGEELSISGAGIEELKLRPGQYRFQATKDGQPVKTELVSITRGDRKVVVIGLESSKVSPQAEDTSADYRSIPEGAIREVRRIAPVSDGKWVSNLQFSPSGKELLCARQQNRLEILNLDSAATAVVKNAGSKVAVSRSGELVAVCQYNSGRVKLWNLKSLQQILDLEAHSPSHATSISISQDENHILSASDDKTARVWDIKTGQEIHRFDCKTGCNIATYSHDGKTILIGDHDERRLFDADSFNLIANLQTGYIQSAAFSPSGEFLLTGSNDVIRLWNASTGKKIREFYGHTDAVRSLEFLPDHRHFISGSNDRTMRVWNVESGREVARVTTTNHVTNEISISPDGKLVASGGGHYWSSGEEKHDGDYDIRIWQLPESVGPKDSVEGRSNNN
jgi:serine/threonine protein kinase/WD40 repeat protein